MLCVIPPKQDPKTRPIRLISWYKIQRDNPSHVMQFIGLDTWIRWSLCLSVSLQMSWEMLRIGLVIFFHLFVCVFKILSFANVTWECPTAFLVSRLVLESKFFVTQLWGLFLIIKLIYLGDGLFCRCCMERFERVTRKAAGHSQRSIPLNFCQVPLLNLICLMTRVFKLDSISALYIQTPFIKNETDK